MSKFKEFMQSGWGIFIIIVVSILITIGIISAVKNAIENYRTAKVDEVKSAFTNLAALHDSEYGETWAKASMKTDLEAVDAAKTYHSKVAALRTVKTTWEQFEPNYELRPKAKAAWASVKALVAAL